MAKLSAKAVIVGGLADVLLSGTFSVILDLIFMAHLGTIHSAQNHAHLAAAAMIKANVPLQSAALFLGIGCSVFGGYVAAQIAHHDELWNGAASSLLCVFIGLLTLASGRDSRAFAVQVLVLLASPACGMLGGYLSTLKTNSAIVSKSV